MIPFIKQLCVFLLLIGVVAGGFWFALWIFSYVWIWLVFGVVLLPLLLMMLWAAAGKIVND